MNEFKIIEFKIICIRDCTCVGYSGMEVRAGSVFTINNYEFNYGPTYLRIVQPNTRKIYGICDRDNFSLLEEYRNNKIEEILKHE